MVQKLTTKNEIDTFMLNPVNDIKVLNNKDNITLFNDGGCPNIKKATKLLIIIRYY